MKMTDRYQVKTLNQIDPRLSSLKEFLINTVSSEMQNKAGRRRIGRRAAMPEAYQRAKADRPNPNCDMAVILPG
jgi:hypothetical protein